MVKFLGVPFAPEPVRFAESELLEHLGDSPFEAFEHGPKCWGARGYNNVDATEDCLHLNIYVKKAVLKGQRHSQVLQSHGL